MRLIYSIFRFEIYENLMIQSKAIKERKEIQMRRIKIVLVHFEENFQFFCRK